MRERTEDSGLDLDVGALRAALRQAPVRRAILFGSYARGTERASSDVDVAVEFEEGLSSLERTRARLRLIESLGAALGLDEVDVVPLSSAPDTLRKEIENEGIVIIGAADDPHPTTDRSTSDDEAALDRFDEVLSELDGLV